MTRRFSTFRPPLTLAALLLAAAMPLAACGAESQEAVSDPAGEPTAQEATQAVTSDTAVPDRVEAPDGETLSSEDVAATGEATAIVAGGCFWCVEADFEKMDEVSEVVSGYSGGDSVNPRYRNYEDGGHREVAKIYFDRSALSYRELYDRFFRTVDPTDDGGQFCDRGFGYTTAIYVDGEEQRAAAEAAKAQAAEVLDQEIVTPIIDAGPFYEAEDYHQDYYEKSSLRYGVYRRGCGRDARLRRLWGDEAIIK